MFAARLVARTLRRSRFLPAAAVVVALGGALVLSLCKARSDYIYLIALVIFIQVAFQFYVVRPS